MKDDDDDENTSIHWFCLIPPPRVSRSVHIFSPEWKTSLSLSEGIRCFSTMIKKHFMWMLNFDLTPPWKCNCWDVIKPQIFKLLLPKYNVYKGTKHCLLWWGLIWCSGEWNENKCGDFKCPLMACQTNTKTPFVKLKLTHLKLIFKHFLKPEVIKWELWR